MVSVRRGKELKVRYWLMKSEPETFSIEDLRRAGVSGWDGVRNYSARNFLREMSPGDLAFFYHSSAKPAGVAGVMEIMKAAYPDPTQFDPKNDHYDAKAAPGKPIWLQVEVKFKAAFKKLLSLEEMRGLPGLSGMLLFTRGRLSVQPVTAAQWSVIIKKTEE